jgi:hypothetical protein
MDYDYGSILITLLIVAAFCAVGIAWTKGYYKGKEDKAARDEEAMIPKEVLPAKGESVCKTSQRYTDALKGFAKSDGDSTPTRRDGGAK